MDTDAATDTDTDSEGGGGPKFDVVGGGAPAGGGDGTGGVPCSLVDVIFSVDNSESMQEEIAVLRGPVFNSLPEQLLAVGNGLDDFNLAVIDACPKPAHYHDTGKSGACGFSTGANYMSSSSPDLTGEFECVSDISPMGYMGQNDMCEDNGALKDDDEQPALTAASSVHPDLVSGVNAGFLRSNALLFVVAITDEDEEMLGTSVDGITQGLIDAKGSVENVVFLGIGGGSNCDGPYGSALAANNLEAVTNVFVNANRGVFWNLCNGDLEGAFASIIDVVDTACFEFTPPG